MRSLIAPILLLALALLGLSACPAQTQAPSSGSAPSGGGSRKATATQFTPVATAAQLGAAYSAAGGPEAIRALYADAAGSTALLTLRGSTQALWLTLGGSSAAQSIDLQHEVLGVDMERKLAYAIADSSPGVEIEPLVRSLPDGQWAPLLKEGRKLPRGAMLGIYSHPGSDAVWVLTRMNFSPGGTESEQAAPPAVGEAQLWDCAWRIQDGAYSLIGQHTLNLSAEDMLKPAAAAALSNGSLAYSPPDRGRLYLFGESGTGDFELAAGRRVTLAADRDEPVVWASVAPENAGIGTGRAGEVVEVGTLLVFGAKGELARMPSGQVPMSGLAGDWKQQRCFFAQPSVGIAVADLAQRELRWPLRQSSETPLYLVGGGTLAWNVLPEAIVGMKTDDLAAMGESMAASQVLPLNELKQVRPVAEGLGWDWGRTQISPLLASTGRLTMFDGHDVASSLAEFDWDSQRQRVSSLLITRVPVKSDEDLLKLDDAALKDKLDRLLRKMGWPQAQQDNAHGFHTPDELKVVYLLEPPLSADAAAPPPVPSGEFTLWITSQAALLSLEPAGEPLPQGALASGELRRKAAEAADNLAQADGLSDAELRVELMPQAGWLAGSADPKQADVKLQSTQGEGGKAAVRIRAIARSAAQTRVYDLLLDALSGELLGSRGMNAGAFLMLRVDDTYGPAGEFGVAGAAAASTATDSATAPAAH